MKKRRIEAIVTVGPIGSGKDTAIKYISKKYGIPMVSMGDLVVDIARHDCVEPTRDNLLRISERYVKLHGSCFFSEVAFRKIETEGWESVAIAGVRYSADIATFRKLLSKLTVIHIRTSEPKKRFERLNNRREPRDPKDFQEFITQDEQERNLFNLRETFRMADFVVENDGTLEELYQKIDAVICRTSTRMRKR